MSSARRASSGDLCGDFRLDAERAAEPFGVPARPHLGVQAQRFAELALSLLGPPDRPGERGAALANGGLVDLCATAVGNLRGAIEQPDDLIRVALRRGRDQHACTSVMGFDGAET